MESPRVTPATTLDRSRLDRALTAFATAWARTPTWDAPNEVLHGVDGLSSLADLLARYDYGEPDWNGSLNLLAKHLLSVEPVELRVSSCEEIPEIEAEGVSRFHHGDVVVSGDFGAFDSVWVTGNLLVEGVIENSYLDAYADLLVGGNVKCRAIQFMGLSMIGGRLDVERFAYVHSQALVYVLGGVRGGALIGEYDSVEDWDASGVSHHIDLDDDRLDALADVLGVTVAPEDEHAFEIVLRALEAASAVESHD